MTEKLKVALGLFALPFLVVWMSYLFTAFTLNYHEIFESNVFWYITGIYWVIYLMIIGPILTFVED